MTREEAIKLFRKEIECLSHDKCSDCILEKVCDPSKTLFDSEYIDAFGVAIEALSAEPCEASAREWCKQNGYVMMPEAVYEQDITKAYFEGQNIEPCEDAISRQAAIDAAIDGADDWDGGYNPTREEYIKKAINALPPVTPKQKMGRWIPVSERLPENSGNYLITYCYRDEIETQEAVYVKDEEGDKWFDITDIEITLAVIAWMPIPEPYRAESEDK